MIIIQPNVELWKPQSKYQHIARCASVCYGSKGVREANDNKDKILTESLIHNNHTSVFRHYTRYYKIPKSVFYTGNTYDLYTNIINSPYVNTIYLNNNYYISTNEQFITDNHLNEYLIYYEISEYQLNNEIIKIENSLLKDENNNYIHSDLHFIKRFTLCVTTQIAISRELNRVSPNNITEESTRFCNYSKDKYTNDVTIVLPHWMDLFQDNKYKFIKYDGKNLIADCNKSSLNIELNKFPIESYMIDGNVNGKAARRFLSHLHKECTYYLEALKDNFPPQDARALLPLNTATTVIYTYSLKKWIDILLLRYYGITGVPHPDAKLIAEKIKRIFIALGYDIDYLANERAIYKYHKSILPTT